VPRHEEVTAEGVVCQIVSAGSITVEIGRRGSVSHSTITGGTVHITAR
jgi:hypothetical protein